MVSPFTKVNSDSTTREITVAPEILLGIATIPTLAAILGIRVLLRGLQDVGEASEELFRRDRLPTLTAPTTPPPEQ